MTLSSSVSNSLLRINCFSRTYSVSGGFLMRSCTSRMASEGRVQTRWLNLVLSEVIRFREKYISNWRNHRSIPVRGKGGSLKLEATSLRSCRSSVSEAVAIVLML